MKRKEARLVLEDGTIFEGTAFGALVESSGEAVFNTSLSGYQEVLTDPSYRGQIVVMTYPHIGNYGINDEDGESPKPWLSGFVVRELSPVVSNWRATEDLGSWLARHGQDRSAVSCVDAKAGAGVERSGSSAGASSARHWKSALPASRGAGGRHQRHSW